MFLEKYRYVHFPPTIFPNIIVDPDKCKGCKICVNSCPTSCLQWDEKKRKPVPTSLGEMSLACIACNNCEAVCPENAIKAIGFYFVTKGRYKTDQGKHENMYYPFNKSEDKLYELDKELNKVEKVIFKRRSVRLFSDKPVEKEKINRILEAGRFAPSAGNCQPYKFLVVTNRKINEEIDIKCSRVLYKIKDLYVTRSKLKKAIVYILSYISPRKWDQRPIAAMEKVQQLGGVITFKAPAVIHILKDVRGISEPDIDVGIVAQNMVLSAHSLGLGTCIIGFIPSAVPFVPSVKKLLGIKYPYKLSLSIAVGYPKVRYDNRYVSRGKIPIEYIS